jgi:hypothetical protein
MPDLLELAARAEAAEGPSRELDGLVFAALNSDKQTVIGNEPGRFPQKPIYGSITLVMERVGGKDGADYIGAPAYTASIDAAASLVPKGWYWTLDNYQGVGNPENGRPCTADIANPPDWDFIQCLGAATPALALTAAALRALASGEKK